MVHLGMDLQKRNRGNREERNNTKYTTQSYLSQERDNQDYLLNLVSHFYED